jgi:hypothetical protein
VHRDSVVGIATCYELESPVIESFVGANFPAPAHTGPGPHPASCSMGTRSFPGVKRSEHGVDHPPPTSVEVKEGVELYINFHSESSWPVLRIIDLYYRCTSSDVMSSSVPMNIKIGLW